MDHDTENALRGLFEADRVKRDDRLSQVEQKELQRSRDLKDFADLCDNVIVPELEKVAAFVCEQGWDAKVIRDPGKPNEPEQLLPPSVGIYIINEGKVRDHRPNELAYIKYLCIAGSSAVSVPTSDILPRKGGSSTSGGLIKFDRVTADMVSKGATDLLQTLLRK